MGMGNSVIGRFAARPYMPGDPLPEVGTKCWVSGANADVESDQHRSFGERIGIGYTPCGLFACFQTEGCWPTVERLINCWFADPDRLAKASGQ